ncbi:MAG: 3-deoxy-D-manno-octulosonic acid transferase, partial [Sinobacterium sp.]|nr:3-deoxy-D-manno-octulosonic acid transferase [Sinobacterium sp.]
MNPLYAERIPERFGYINTRDSVKPCVWMHAVSVGEVIAASPIIKALQQAHPEWDFCMTTTTPTGSDRVKALFGDTVLHYYIPYDVPFLIRRFLDRLRPAMFVSMETELWPNTIAECKKRNMPVLLANARLSARSAKGYSRVYLLVKQMLQNIDLIAAQANADAKRFRCLGASKQRVQVMGSVKFDVTVSDDTHQRVSELAQQLQLEGRKVAIFASTHAGEDELILPMISRLCMLDERFIAIVVPRHLERFQPVRELASKLKLNVVNLTSNSPATKQTHLVLGDTMGDMFALYG